MKKKRFHINQSCFKYSNIFVLAGPWINEDTPYANQSYDTSEVSTEKLATKLKADSDQTCLKKQEVRKPSERGDNRSRSPYITDCAEVHPERHNISRLHHGGWKKYMKHGAYTPSTSSSPKTHKSEPAVRTSKDKNKYAPRHRSDFVLASSETFRKIHTGTQVTEKILDGGCRELYTQFIGYIYISGKWSINF